MSAWLDLLPPGAPLWLGGLLLLFLPLRAPSRAEGASAGDDRPSLVGWGALGAALLSYLHFLGLDSGLSLRTEILGLDLVPVRIDGLSSVWGHIFHIAAVISSLFALHVGDRRQQAAGLVYAGAAIGAVFSGDLATLFVYWELTAIASVFLILAPERGNLDRDPHTCLRVAMRYLIIQVASGVLLLAGMLLRIEDLAGTGVNPLAFGRIHTGSLTDASLATWLLFLAFGIKAAFPLLHNWLQDAYPKATSTGTVFLSAFTTKMAIYALARGFAGLEVLIVLGAIMTAFPIFFAVLENDLRRVLSYSLNNQLGFMCVGIGIGTELALAGAAAHAFAHILYKSLLFQSMGAVIHRVGTAKATALGGLYRTMPFTAACCVIGGLSISAFPLTSGFVSKSLIVTAAAEAHLTWIFLALLFASAGVLDHSGIKVPYFTFFGQDSGLRPAEAPLHMRASMAITAAFCLGLGMFPNTFYRLVLPFDVDYQAYTTLHVVTQLQLLFFAILAFVVLVRTGIYPHEHRATNLDSDWLYRRLVPRAGGPLVAAGRRGWASARAGGRRLFTGASAALVERASPTGALGQVWGIGRLSLATGAVLALYLLYLFARG